MAARKRGVNSTEAIAAEEKIARIMALNAMLEMENNNDKAVFLRSAGFTINETASILNIADPAQVRIALARSKKKKKRSKK